mmetsp:Transcript_4113/g.6545  ORF Transcript_4113/g.6545 Transcript_4113/m.6545 type:complete len:180 (-) Transcript_4113:589-1128(-)
MIPTRSYYFPYPKTADDGKGFGCCISLLLLETTPRLKCLQEVVKGVFPPDERHGNGDGNGNEEVEFKPHVALIYAPENHDNVTNGWLEERTSETEREKRYSNWISSNRNGRYPSEKNNKGTIIGTNNNESSGTTTETMEEGGEETAATVAAAAWDAKYLSVWSTEGTLDEWFPIAKVDL